MNTEQNKRPSVKVCSPSSMVAAVAVLVAIAAVFFAGVMYARGGGGLAAPAEEGLNLKTYTKLARKAGISNKQVKTCLEEGSEARATVEQHIQGAGRMGVSGTPGSFLVNTKTSAVRKIPGALPVEEVRKLLQLVSGPPLPAAEDTDVAEGEGADAVGAVDETEVKNADFSLLRILPNDVVQGNSDILLIEYSDYECPFCKRFHATARALANNGEVTWVYRHLPLPFHATAKDGAVLGECVRMHKGMTAMWKYTDSVFEV